MIIENLSRRRDIIEKLREYGDDAVKMCMKDISNGNVYVLLVSIAKSSLGADANEPLDEEIIAALCRTITGLWFAGYITAALTSICGTFELGYRDGILSRLVKEQEDIINTFAGGEREVSYGQIVSRMPPLDSYLLEFFR